MAREADAERQRRKRSLRVTSRRHGDASADPRDPGPGTGGSERLPPWRRLAVAIGGLFAVVLLGVVVSRLALSGAGERRMDRFAEAPDTVRSDLLYLSYLDSLARDDRAVPATDDSADPTVARTLARLAGVSDRTLQSWGLRPEPEPGHGTLTTVFRELGRRQRVVLPYYDAALWIHLRKRRLHPGYLVFGHTRRAPAGEVDFCAVLTAVNSIQPEFTALIWRDADTGQLVHRSYEELPQFEYYGGGRLGDDLQAVYHEYFQLRDQRDQKPLYQGP